MITGNRYLLRGHLVTVLAQWHQPRPAPDQSSLPLVRTAPTTPRNVLIAYPDGTRRVRPFRGLRRPPANDQADAA